MADTVRGYVQKGWKVYVGGDPVGKVSDVGRDDLGVERGILLKHVVRIPMDCVIDAADGIVDLRADDRTEEVLHAG
jgi:hypothetical protein